MKNWNDFRKSEPILHRIERRFIQLQKFEKKYSLETPGFSQDDMYTAKVALLDSMRADAEIIPGKVYYWLYPFYKGNFLQLVAALGSCGMMEKQKDDDESRQAFYQFFRTVPMEERLQIGKRLNQPELTEKALKIQEKIKAKREAVKKHFNQNHAN